MMRPFWSLVVSFWYCSFHVTTCTAPVGQENTCIFHTEMHDPDGHKNESDDLRLHHLCFVLSSYHYVLQVSGSLRGYWVPQVLSILHHLQTTDDGGSKMYYANSCHFRQGSDLKITKDGEKTAYLFEFPVLELLKARPRHHMQWNPGLCSMTHISI